MPAHLPAAMRWMPASALGLHVREAAYLGISPNEAVKLAGSSSIELPVNPNLIFAYNLLFVLVFAIVSSTEQKCSTSLKVFV